MYLVYDNSLNYRGADVFKTLKKAKAYFDRMVKADSKSELFLCKVIDKSMSDEAFKQLMF